MNGRILVVEDEGIIAADLEESLTEHGYEVVAVCRNGEDAIQAAKKFRPDLVLMDINLAGEMDGTAAARHISKGSDVAIVYLTAFADPRTFDAAQEAGPYGYLVKPFEVETLRTTVETALRRRQKDLEGRRQLRLQDDVLDRMTEGVVFIRPDGHVEQANPAATKLLGQVPVILEPPALDEQGAGTPETWVKFLDATPRRWSVQGKSLMVSASKVDEMIVVVFTPETDPARHQKRSRVTLQALQRRARNLI